MQYNLCVFSQLLALPCSRQSQSFLASLILILTQACQFLWPLHCLYVQQLQFSRMVYFLRQIIRISSIYNTLLNAKPFSFLFLLFIIFTQLLLKIKNDGHLIPWINVYICLCYSSLFLSLLQDSGPSHGL